MKQQHKVEIVNRATNEVVKTVPCDDRASAEAVKRGVDINLNHAEYVSRIG